VMAEDEYETERTLTAFAAEHLGATFQVSLVYGSDTDRHDIPGIDVLEQADLALFSVRRRPLPPAQLAVIRRFVASGKPVLGIRTASHAFSLRGEEPAAGLAAWPEFDAQVFGGNYHGHHANDALPKIYPADSGTDHPLAVPAGWSLTAGGSLYQVSPLSIAALPLLTGEIEGQPPEPVAWTFTRADGGRSFYTSLGQKADFDNRKFVGLLSRALAWGAGLPAAQPMSDETNGDSPAVAEFTRHWSLVTVPDGFDTAQAAARSSAGGAAWYRCVIRMPAEWRDGSLSLVVKAMPDSDVSAWLNGQPATADADAPGQFKIAAEGVLPGDANLLVLRLEGGAAARGLSAAPRIQRTGNSEAGSIDLTGRWQFRLGDDATWCNMPLPARFGGSPDIVVFDEFD